MAKTLTTRKYARSLRRIRDIIEKGRLRAQRAVEQHVLETNWEIGRVMVAELLPDDGPSAENARVVGRLSSDLARPKSLIYRIIKFYKCYPQRLPLDLSWSHYSFLTQIDDQRTRLRLEQKAIREGIPSKVLYGLIVGKKQKNVPQFPKDKQSGGRKLLFTRGELYFYRCVRRAGIALKKNERLVDVGFGILRKVRTPVWKSNSHMLHVRSYKKEGEYTVRIARPNDHKLFTYMATVQRVIDGDTLELNFDLGFDTWIREKVRLRGIDCPEKTANRGKLAHKYVRNALGKLKFIVVKTYKDDKYGRMLADIFYLPKEKGPATVAQSGIFLNQALLDKGLAEVWKG